MNRAFAPISFLAALLPLAAAALDWGPVKDVDTVHVVVTEQGGQPREVEIWIAVVEGEAYIRTSSGSSWGDDVERNPEITLRVGEAEYPLRAEFVEDDSARERITAAFREKYGRFDAMLRWVRGRARIMHLLPR